MARTSAKNVAEPVDQSSAPEVPEVLKGVTTDAPTPPGDAKEQARQARREALQAKKDQIAAAAAAKAGSNGSAPKDAPKADAPSADAPQDEPKAEEPAPRLTTADKLRELKAIAEGRRDYAKVVKEMVTGLEAILEDLARQPTASQPKATRPRGDDAAKAKAASELEQRMLTHMQAQGAIVDGTPITLQDVMRQLGFDMKDAKPYNAMVRMRNDGRVKVVVDKAPRQFVVA